jgi:hypothetical protein
MRQRTSLPINLAILPRDNAATLLFACQIRELNTQFYDLAKECGKLVNARQLWSLPNAK